jgi:hypothetical protein
LKLDNSTPGVVKVNITEYIKGTIMEFPEQLPESSKIASGMRIYLN